MSQFKSLSESFLSSFYFVFMIFLMTLFSLYVSVRSFFNDFEKFSEFEKFREFVLSFDSLFDSMSANFSLIIEMFSSISISFLFRNSYMNASWRVLDLIVTYSFRSCLTSSSSWCSFNSTWCWYLTRSSSASTSKSCCLLVRAFDFSLCLLDLYMIRKLYSASISVQRMWRRFSCLMMMKIVRFLWFEYIFVDCFTLMSSDLHMTKLFTTANSSLS